MSDQVVNIEVEEIEFDFKKAKELTQTPMEHSHGIGENVKVEKNEVEYE